jgi:hypothetical protein
MYTQKISSNQIFILTCCLNSYKSQLQSRHKHITYNIHTKCRKQRKCENKFKLNTCNQSKHLHVTKNCPQERQCFCQKCAKICLSSSATTQLSEVRYLSTFLAPKVENRLIYLMGARIRRVFLTEWQWGLAPEDINTK